jgi:hypothetical protein
VIHRAACSAKRVLLRRDFLGARARDPHLLERAEVAQRRIGRAPHALVGPVGVDRRLEHDRQKRRIEHRRLAHLLRVRVEFPENRMAVIAGGRDREHQRLIPRALRRRQDVPEFARRRGVQFVVNHRRGVEPVLGVRLGRDRAVETPARAMHDPFLRVDELTLREELGVVANHLGRNVEHKRRLVLVRGGRVHLGALLTIEQQKVQRERRGQFRLAVLARQHQQTLPIDAAAVGARAEELLEDAPLPRAEGERLPRKRAFGVREVVDQPDRAARVALTHARAPAHLLATARGGAVGIRARLAGSSANRA